MQIRRGFQRYQESHYPSAAEGDAQPKKQGHVAIAQQSMSSKRRSHFNEDQPGAGGQEGKKQHSSSLPQANGVFAAQQQKYGKPAWTQDNNMQIQMVGPPSPNNAMRGTQRRTPTNSVQNLTNQRMHTSGAAG